MSRADPSETPTGLLILMTVQMVCAVFFIADVLRDLADEGGIANLDLHLGVEMIATLSLFAAILLEARLVARILRRKRHLEASLATASAEVHEVILAQFGEWSLSPAEADVAMFLVKGLGTQAIADLRGSAEGTIKAHFNAIFRKAGVHSRAELLSVLIDRLLAGRLAA